MMAAIKMLFLVRATNKFWHVIESDVAEIYFLSRPALMVIAAHIYANNRIASDSMFSVVHLLPVMQPVDNTEPNVYVGYDESIEKRRY